MHLKPHLHQVLNHLLNLSFVRHVLHRHNHKKSLSYSRSAIRVCPRADP
jgi:hypothetical protein